MNVMADDYGRLRIPRAPTLPFTFPLVGHAPQLLCKGLLGLVKDACGQSGRVTRLVLGRQVTHVLSHPDHLRYVFVDHEKNFIKGTALDHLRLLLGDGLITNDGAAWKRARGLAQPAFRRERMGSFAALASRPISDLLRRWERGPGVATSDLHEEMKRLVVVMSGLTLFGIDLGAEADEATRAFATALHVIADRIENVFALPVSVPTPANLRLRRAVKTLDEHVQRIVEERRDTSGADVLSMFLHARAQGGDGFSDRQLRDEVITLYLAGHDATSHSLAWALHFCAQHPDVQGRIRAEVKAVCGDGEPGWAEIQRLVYTRMVIQEALRLRPPGAVVARQVVDADSIDGARLPAGSWVLLCPYLTHHLPEFWPHPERFDPERFGAKEAEKRHPFSFYPFGSGPRICIGNHLAMMEMQMVMARLLRAYAFEHPKGAVVTPIWHATLRPRGGLPMVRRRLATDCSYLDATG